MSKRHLFCSLVIMMTMACSVAIAGVFDPEEIQVAPSPSELKLLDFKESEKVLDFDVARSGPRAAVLVQDSSGGARIVFWDIGSPESTTEWVVPKGFGFRSVAWHPLGKSFFLSGIGDTGHVIARVDGRGSSWAFRVIYRAHQEIRRLVPAPRPYIIGSAPNRDEVTKAYRLFFGLKNPDGTYAVRSITEQGSRDYQVIGPKKGFSTFKDAGEQPSRLEALSALPLAFHPAGHILLWEDEKKCFHQALYRRDHWEKRAKLALCGGTLTPAPNGFALIHWQAGAAGVEILSDHGKKKSAQASEYNFLSTPSSVPDGKGIVGTLKRNNRISLAYVPIRVPLADVANAWMYMESIQDEDLLERKGGLLRDLPDEQLYSLYESEAYQCGEYDPSTPTRPYLVTTDIFWELLAAAYEGLFIVAERQQAIPAFWELVDGAEQFFRQTNPASRWTGVFSVLSRMRKSSGDKSGEEAGRAEIQGELALIRKAEGKEVSPVLGKLLDYGELKPRGHYASSEAMITYFKAFKYLTQLAGDVLIPEGDVSAPEEHVHALEELNKMGPEVKARARSWIGAYEAFIPSSRSPVVLRDEQLPIPPYTKHPLNRARIFPLAWGFDNEVLLSTVFHEDWPEVEQIKGPSGSRIIPSGLDVAAALGSRFAAGLLSGEMKKYPPLETTIEDLRTRWQMGKVNENGRANLYGRWIDALAVQWADGVAPPENSRGRELWDTKRLQTGLASWATLRHATVLVNERTAAECGEGAFEPILLAPPRGYVEPDPDTFHAIAAFFRSMEQMVKSWKVSPESTIQMHDTSARKVPKAGTSQHPLEQVVELVNGKLEEALKAGIAIRLEETAAKAALFEKIARKELAGEPLTDKEYEEILYVGRIAEHHFLIFKSLAAEDYALSHPDPMPKIADVSGGGPFNIPFLMAAVGNPMEWDQIVPYFGRKEMVKGAVYSYYEFVSEQLMNDKEWLESLPTRHHPDWASPFVSGSAGSCPPGNPY